MYQLIRTIKKTIVYILVMLFTLPVLAVHASYGIEEQIYVDALNLNSTFEITLMAEPGTTVGLEILYPDAVFPPASANLMDTFAYLGQKTVDSNGRAVFTYTPQKQGEYTVRAGYGVRDISIELGNREPLFSITWGTTPALNEENIYKPYWLDRAPMRGDVKQVASKIKSFLEEIPSGKKGIYVAVTDLAGGIFNNEFKDNYLWYDAGVADVKGAIDDLFEEYKNIGGEVDYIIMDMELSPMSTSTLGTDDKSIYNAIANDKRYVTEIRPLLEERGYQFYTPDFWDKLLGRNRSELYSVDESPNNSIWNVVVQNRTASYLNEAICEPILQYFPEVKISNYGYIDGEGWHKVTVNNGTRTYLGGNTIKVGTHSNVSSYGALGWMAKNPSGFSSGIGPEDYYGTMYDGTPFHSLLFDNNKLRKAWLSDESRQVQAWVGVYDVNYAAGTGYVFGYGDTPYYAENIFHVGLLNPDPFLFFGYSSNKTNGDAPTAEEKEIRGKTFSSLLSELNELVGFSDRRPLVKGLASWNNRYLLSGMYANGRNIWRITPDLTVEGMTVEKFCTDKVTPTFSIDGKTITFPQGKIYTSTVENNTCGYWVITPENVEPIVTYAKNTEHGEFYAKMQIYEEDTGTVISKIPSDCGMTSRVSLNNLTTKDENLTLFMASYEGEELQTVELLSQKKVYSGEDNVIFVEDIPKPDSSTTRVSFYLWGENLQPFVPLATLYR